MTKRTFVSLAALLTLSVTGCSSAGPAFASNAEAVQRPATAPPSTVPSSVSEPAEIELPADPQLDAEFEAELEPAPDAEVDPAATWPRVAVARGPDNALIVTVNVELAEPATVTLMVEAAHTTRFVESIAMKRTHAFTVAGLRAETEYLFTAKSDGASSDVVPFLTGALPVAAPTIDIVQASASTGSLDGVTFFAVGPPREAEDAGATFFGVDSAGEVVWYLERPGRTVRNPHMRSLEGDEILVFLAGVLEHRTLTGTLIASYDLSNVAGYHHDAVLLPDGGVLALGIENREAGGPAIRSDSIVELDASGDVVWEWSSFDHLDTTRFPGEMASTEGRAGGLDWSHSNSVFFDAASNQILLSVRSQNWIVNIDRASGDIAWIAGESSMTSPDFSAEFLELTSGSWTSGQHAATWTAAGELLAYDNGNETTAPGPSRVVIYEIDESAGQAKEIFAFIAPKYTASLGDVDELANGNLLITAGGPGSDTTARLVEVTRKGETVWDAAIPGRIYRSERVTWDQLSTTN